MESGLIFNIFCIILPGEYYQTVLGLKNWNLTAKMQKSVQTTKCSVYFFQKQEQSDEYGNVTYSERKRFSQVFGQK